MATGAPTQAPLVVVHSPHSQAMTTKGDILILMVFVLFLYVCLLGKNTAKKNTAKLSGVVVICLLQYLLNDPAHNNIPHIGKIALKEEEDGVNRKGGSKCSRNKEF